MLRHFVRVITLAVLVLGLVAGIASAAPGSNKANAKFCQKGGWEQLQRVNGTPFASQEECVSYGAQGGTLQPIPTTVTVSFIAIPLHTVDCGVRVEVTGFAPGTYDALISVVEEDGDSGSITRSITVGPDGQ